MRFNISTSVVCFIAMVAAAPFVLGAGFADTCSKISLSGTTLSAVCKSKSGTATSTSIDLNRCVTNTNGVLQCAVNGNYAASCRRCGLEGGLLDPILNCDCGSGTTLKSLNDCLSNIDGILSCP